MPSHNHAATAVSTLHATSNTANQNAAENGILASSSSFGGTPLYHAGPPDVTLDSSSVSTGVTVSNNGGGQPVNVRNPFLGMQWCAALVGTYPSRN